MNKREESKLETRLKILDNTTRLLLENGFVKVSTKEIAKASGVSQGSIFLHFESKENLLISILESNMNQLENDLDERCKDASSMDDFIRLLLDVLVQHENMLARAYKDYPYLTDSLQKQIDDLESTMKNHFFDIFKQNRSTVPNIIDSFILIDAFLSQIKNYLLEKNVFSVTNSILRQRRGRIMKLHRMMFGDIRS